MPQIKNFDEAHKVLAKYVDRSKQIGGYKLDRMQSLMQALGNPQDNYKVIHIAGTSGKSSTCYYMAALLVEAGQKVGLTVSPHVDEVNERVQINLSPLPEVEFCRQLGEFIQLVDKTGLEPTYFELLVAFAFWQFDRQKVDYAVVEVGLGGLLDGTNVIHRPDKICVITDIGLDHTNVLGNSISEIAAQKAGIIQDHNHVFMYGQIDEVMKQVIERCKQMHATLHTIEPKPNQIFKQRNFYLAKNIYDFVAQNENWPTLAAFKLDTAKDLNIPARMEVRQLKEKTVIIDGSHNGQKMAALVEAVQRQYTAKKAVVLVSFVDSEAKRVPDALTELKHLTDKVIITSFTDSQDTPKQSVAADQIAAVASQVGFENIIIIENPKIALEKLLSQPEDVLIITGSFYLLNHIRPHIK